MVLAPDTAPVNVSNTVVGAFPDLIQALGRDPRHVLTSVDFAGAAKLGVRTSFDDNDEALIDESGTPRLDTAAATNLASALRHDVFGEIVQLAAKGKFTIPIARTLPL